MFGDDEVPRITAIEFYHDSKLCFGYEVFYQNGAQVGHHIGSMLTPEVKCYRYEL